MIKIPPTPTAMHNPDTIPTKIDKKTSLTVKGE